MAPWLCTTCINIPKIVHGGDIAQKHAVQVNMTSAMLRLGNRNANQNALKSNPVLEKNTIFTYAYELCIIQPNTNNNL